MKITMIHGQNHKGSTYHIGRMLAEALEKEENITEFFLPRDLNHFCLGCYTCIENEEKCPFYEEKKRIADAMEQADLLIFTTPNYCMAPSAPLKAFIDLFYQYWIPHRPRKCMFSKKAVVISTTAGAGAGCAIKTVKRTLAYWGIPYIKTYGVAVQASCWEEVKADKKEKILKDMVKLAGKLRRASCGKPSPYIRFMFRMMVLSRKNQVGDLPAETGYWKEHGWLNGRVPWKDHA
ncbi:MAG: NAD(P)H-dependent oxidoreductase [Lachnospiraceae bacterium]|nr:NAD(P)H-dependent oxidoreductase [Lachnospiraceae bacterium]MDD7176929.1 NAD(P)H-dependent oxidoreductase [bacterium]MDY5517640.1 NAD(P)H-dependent oxidoreductase [Lachnospiraceae bacterium]